MRQKCRKAEAAPPFNRGTHETMLLIQFKTEKESPCFLLCFFVVCRMDRAFQLCLIAAAGGSAFRSPLNSSLFSFFASEQIQLNCIAAGNVILFYAVRQGSLNFRSSGRTNRLSAVQGYARLERTGHTCLRHLYVGGSPCNRPAPENQKRAQADRSKNRPHNIRGHY